MRTAVRGGATEAIPLVALRADPIADGMRGVTAAMLVLFSRCSLACTDPLVAPRADEVAVTVLPPPPTCEQIASIRGRAGTGWPPPEMTLEEQPQPYLVQLLAQAQNDLRDRAVAVGANYVHRSEPALTAWSGTITAAAYAGLAYRCPRRQRWTS